MEPKNSIENIHADLEFTATDDQWTKVKIKLHVSNDLVVEFNLPVRPELADNILNAHIGKGK